MFQINFCISCKCGDRCTNKNFQKRAYPALDVFWAAGKGHGLQSKEKIKNGDFIIEYMGEVVSAKDFKKRSHEYSKTGQKHHYFMELSQGQQFDTKNYATVPLRNITFLNTTTFAFHIEL